MSESDMVVRFRAIYEPWYWTMSSAMYRHLQHVADLSKRGKCYIHSQPARRKSLMRMSRALREESRALRRRKPKVRSFRSYRAVCGRAYE
jgi:hypothetical protein